MTAITESIDPAAAARPSVRRIGAAAGLAAGPLFLTIVVVLTIVERGWLHRYGWSYLHDNNVPWPSGLSVSRYGPLQIANFAITGLLLLTWVRALAGELRGVTGRIATALLTIQGAALAISAVRVDHQMMLTNSPSTWNGYVHGIAFFFVAVPSVLAPLFVGLALRRDPSWRPLARLSFVVPPLALAIFFTPLGGLSFTLFLALLFGWIALLAHRLLER